MHQFKHLLWNYLCYPISSNKNWGSVKSYASYNGPKYGPHDLNLAPQIQAGKKIKAFVFYSFHLVNSTI